MDRFNVACLHAFVLHGVASLLVYRPRPGRPAKLTASQRQELAQLLVDVDLAELARYDVWT